MAGDSLDDLVKPELLQTWNDEIKPSLFAKKDDVRSQKTPGLLKSEFKITNGEFIALRVGIIHHVVS